MEEIDIILQRKKKKRKRKERKWPTMLRPHGNLGCIVPETPGHGACAFPTPSIRRYILARLFVATFVGPACIPHAHVGQVF